MRVPQSASCPRVIKYTEHRLTASAIIHITNSRYPHTRLPRIILLPLSFKDLIVHASGAIAVELPSLDATTVDMRPEYKADVA